MNFRLVGTTHLKFSCFHQVPAGNPAGDMKACCAEIIVLLCKCTHHTLIPEGNPDGRP